MSKFNSLSPILAATLIAGMAACSNNNNSADMAPDLSVKLDFSSGTQPDQATATDLAVQDLATPQDLAHDLKGDDLANTMIVVGGTTLAFTPQTLTVKAGTTVTWTWSGGSHTVTSGTVTNGAGTPDGKFCNGVSVPSVANCTSQATQNSGTYSFTFPNTGTYPYFCRPHASFGMTGTIIVD